MNIDWSKAPEDATHAGTTTTTQKAVFYKDIREDKYSFWNDNGCGWRKDAIGRPVCTPLIERPKKQEAWDGVGLPPVGTVCECHLPGELIQNYSWVEAKIIWHNGPTECAVVRSTSKLAWCDEFRPIRTAEQVAAEEREKAIKEICIDAGSPEMTPGQMKAAEKLYNKGYRKQ